MRFDSSTLHQVKRKLGVLATRQFDSALPQMKRTEEYLRRMQRRASICVPLANVDGQASLILTLRSQKVGTHRGQVGFPGGHFEEGETAESACLRELKEEIALEAETLGTWHDVRAVTGTMVTPVVCFVPSDSLSGEDVRQVSSTSDEVDLAFHVYLEDLFRPEFRTMELIRENWFMPRFQVTDSGGSPLHPPIWGLTAFVIDGVLRDILAPSLSFKKYPEFSSALVSSPEPV